MDQFPSKMQLCDFFDLSEMLMDQLLLLQYAVENVLKDLEERKGISLTVHNLIVFYVGQRRSFDPR